jgi:hypothetical protein
MPVVDTPPLPTDFDGSSTDFLRAIVLSIGNTLEVREKALNTLIRRAVLAGNCGLQPSNQPKEEVAPPRYTAEELKRWWPAICPKCGWRGLSRDCKGGEQNYDASDYADCICPLCYEKDITSVVDDDETS